MTAQFRLTLNRIRPYNPLGYRSPVPETILPTETMPTMVGLTWQVAKRLGQVTGHPFTLRQCTETFVVQYT